MKAMLPPWVLLALVAGCGDAKDAGETGDPRETGDSADSGESGDSADSGDSGLPDEVCNGVDDDGDGLVDVEDPDLVDGLTAYPDADGDTYGDGTAPVTVCALAADQTLDGSDCNDARADVSPAGVEVCDNVDQDCDGEVDDDVAGAPVWYPDADGDGYGDPSGAPLTTCVEPEGYTTDDSDCLDSAAECNPGVRGRLDCEATVDCDCDGNVEHQCAGGDLPIVAYNYDFSYFGTDHVTHVDVTGDGVADLVAAAPWAESAYGGGGTIDVYPGPITPALAAGGGEIDGAEPASDVGTDIDAADFDGDGIGDLVYAGSGADEPGDYTAPGAAFLHFGPITTGMSELDADWQVDTADRDHDLAQAIGVAGDADGDGDQDLAVSYTGSAAGGSVWLFSPVSGQALDVADGEVGVYSETDGDDFGAAMAAGRDVNGDGQVDLVVGAPGASGGAGEVRVFWGPISGAEAASTADVTITGTGDDAGVGTDVEVVDDIDLDGLPELFLPRTAGAPIMGAAVAGEYLTTDAPLVVLPTGGASITMFYRMTGSALVSDLNNDGTPDLVVGNDGTSVDYEGLLTVFLGPVASGVSQTDANLWWHGGLYEGFGAENRLLGDTDGDGFPEFLTTTYDYFGGGYILFVDGADVR